MKYESLRIIFKDINKAAVAFSGGVDSTLLLKIAQITLNGDVLAIHGDSVLQKEEDKKRVRSIAKDFGVRLFVKEYYPLSWPEFLCFQVSC